MSTVARTYMVDADAVADYIRGALDTPANLAAAADGIRSRSLGWAYFARADSVFWHEMTAAEQSPWIERARAEFEALEREGTS